MIPYDWNKFVNHVKNLIIIILQIGVFKSDENHFQMEDDKICEMGHLKKKSFQMFFGQLIQNKT